MLPDFPTDELTLAAVEHALGGCLTFDDEDGSPLPEGEGPRRIGADYSLDTLLDFMSGTMSMDDPQVEYLPEHEWIHGIPTVIDNRPHYTERDVIQALINEVRRLREERQ